MALHGANKAKEASQNMIKLAILFLTIAIIAGLWFFGTFKTDQKSADKVNIFSNVNFSQLLPSERPIGEDNKSKPSNVNENPPSQKKNTSSNQSKSLPDNSFNTQTQKLQNYSLNLVSPSDMQRVGSVVAPKSTALFLQQMLQDSTNTIKLLELKNQIESIYPKPEKGDIKLARTLNQQGLIAFSRENYFEAANLFLEAANANLADIEVLNNYAFALLRLGNNSMSEMVLGYVLSFAPSRTSAWANLAEVYANLNRVDASAAAFVVGFQFSGNREKTLEFFNKTAIETNNSRLREAIYKALNQLSNS